MTQVIMNYLTIFTKAYVSSQSRGKLKFPPPPHPANDGMYMRMQCHGAAIQLLRPRSLVKKFTAAAT